MFLQSKQYKQDDVDFNQKKKKKANHPNGFIFLPISKDLIKSIEKYLCDTSENIFLQFYSDMGNNSFKTLKKKSTKERLTKKPKRQARYDPKMLNSIGQTYIIIQPRKESKT